MNHQQEALYSIALRKSVGVGDITFQKLIEEFGSAERVWLDAPKILKNINKFNKNVSSEIGNEHHLDFAKKELDFCEKHNIKILLRHFEELPYYLNSCDDAPAILYQKGNIPDTPKPISIVGTREITAYGRNFVKHLLSEINNFNAITIRGLAYGVDTETHEQSLQNNIPTIAVLAHGLHMLYPSKNKRLSEQILEQNGALLTEFNSSQKPDREHFLQRNRIVAGLSQSLIIVETAFGGGSISTATYANNYNRDVYALPGKITDKYSQGCNHLIFQNKAMAISSIKELVKLLGFNTPKTNIGELFPTKTPDLSEQQKPIYQCIKNNHKITLDDLSEKMKISTFELLPILLEMEILGVIQSFSGRQFSVS